MKSNGCCIECGAASNYKCPTCREPYCSVACCKKHKEKLCKKPAPDSNPQNEDEERGPDYEYPTDDTVPLDRLKLLENSPGLRKCLENPHVRTILEELDKTPYPERLIGNYMQEPIFTEFVDECLKVVQSQDNTE